MRFRTLILALLALVVVIVPTVAAAVNQGGPAVTHPLEVIEQTRALLSDLAAYGKFLLPGIAILYFVLGSILRAMAGDDEMKRAKADRTLSNAKVGLVLGLVASPLLMWLQLYYT